MAAAEKRSWTDEVACNSRGVLELRWFEEIPLGENAAAPPQTTEATKTVRKETILILLCCTEELYHILCHGSFSTLTADAIHRVFFNMVG